MSIPIEERKNAIRLSKQISEIVQLIMHYFHEDEQEAIIRFYKSETYNLLSAYDTKTWWLSIPAIFDIYKTEIDTGSPFNSFYILETYN